MRCGGGRGGRGGLCCDGAGCCWLGGGRGGRCWLGGGRGGRCWLGGGAKGRCWPNPVCANCTVPEGPESCDAEANAPTDPGGADKPLATKAPNTCPTADKI